MLIIAQSLKLWVCLGLRRIFLKFGGELALVELGFFATGGPCDRSNLVT